jgi:surface protein
MGCCNSCPNGGRFNIPGLLPNSSSGGFSRCCQNGFTFTIDLSYHPDPTNLDIFIGAPFGTYDPDAIADWGDGTCSPPNADGAGHIYSEIGIYTVRLCGFSSLNLDVFEVGQCLISINSWGSFGIQSLEIGCPPNCSEILPSASPLFLPNTSLASCFAAPSGQTKNWQNLEFWNVANVINMNSMFRNLTDFNGDITGWNVSNVQTMGSMFAVDLLLPGRSFDQNISVWTPINCTNFNFFLFQDSPLTPPAFSPNNLALIYANWSTLPMQPNLIFEATPSQYTIAIGSAGRSILENPPFDWFIYDGGGI